MHESVLIKFIFSPLTYITTGRIQKKCHRPKSEYFPSVKFGFKSLTRLSQPSARLYISLWWNAFMGKAFCFEWISLQGFYIPKCQEDHAAIPTVIMKLLRDVCGNNATSRNTVIPLITRPTVSWADYTGAAPFFMPFLHASRRHPDGQIYQGTVHPARTQQPWVLMVW